MAWVYYTIEALKEKCVIQIFMNQKLIWTPSQWRWRPHPCDWQACSAVSLSSHHSCSARAATESELRKMRMRVVCGLWVTQTEDSDLTTQWAPAGGSSESLSSGCDGCLLSSTCFLSDELTGISSLLIWIVLELRLIEKLGVLMLRSSLVHLCVSGTLRASVTHVFLWWLVLV